MFKEMLENTKSIAVIGIKNDETEIAYKVPFYMQKHGYRIYPVNPKFAEANILGEHVYDKVNHIIDVIDMVNVFRKPEYLVVHAEEILQMKTLPQYVWFQLGIYNDSAAEMLKNNGIKVIQNRCIMVEHANL
ncbi:MAG: CoA-binding protein [Ignavibacteria bacterium]|nr:CoA-binding protein [Ignavibacteria bacterium]